VGLLALLDTDPCTRSDLLSPSYLYSYVASTMDVSLCHVLLPPLPSFLVHCSGARVHVFPPPSRRPAVCGVLVQLGHYLVVPGHLQRPHLRSDPLVRLHPAGLHQRAIQHSPGEGPRESGAGGEASLEVVITPFQLVQQTGSAALGRTRVSSGAQSSKKSSSKCASTHCRCHPILEKEFETPPAQSCGWPRARGHVDGLHTES
jgi:hypothetical protein